MPVPPGACVVVNEQLRVIAVFESVSYRCQRTGRKGVVAVEEEYVPAGCCSEPCISSTAEPCIFSQVQWPNPRVAGGDVVNNCTALVRGAVVDSNNLDVGEVLLENR